MEQSGSVGGGGEDGGEWNCKFASGIWQKAEIIRGPDREWLFRSTYTTNAGGKARVGNLCRRFQLCSSRELS